MANQVARVIQFRTDVASDTGVPSTVSTSLSRVGGVETQPGIASLVSSPAPGALAAQILTIQDLGNGRAFVFPLYVSAEPVGGEWLTTSLDLGLVGRGETATDALDDVREQIAELFESLEETRETLGPYLRSQLAFLERLAGGR